MASSANFKWDTLVLLLPTRKPSNNQLSFALNNILLNTLATMVNRKWDNGSLCLRPLVTLTRALAFTFTKTTKFVINKQALIQVFHLELNHLLSNTWFRKPQST